MFPIENINGNDYLICDSIPTEEELQYFRAKGIIRAILRIDNVILTIDYQNERYFLIHEQSRQKGNVNYLRGLYSCYSDLKRIVEQIVETDKI